MTNNTSKKSAPKSETETKSDFVKASEICVAYDEGKISRSKAFAKLKALGYDTETIRYNLGDFDPGLK